MSIHRVVRSLAAAAVLVFAGSAAHAQLDPPSGPVEETGTPLGEINPGTPISSLPSAANAVHVISEPGRYYLDRDIADPGAGVFAILVTTSTNVTIDMNGFAIDGNGAETQAAIGLDAGVVTIENGTIRDWGSFAIVENDATLTLRRLVLRNIAGASAAALNRYTVIEDCVFDANANPLRFNGGTVAGVQPGIVIKDTRFIAMPAAIDASNAVGVQLLDCNFSGLGAASSAIKVVLGADAQVVRCNFHTGGENGLQAGDGAQILDSRFTGIVTGSTFGISVGNAAVISRCIVKNYSGNGINALNNCLIEGTAVNGCGAVGILIGSTGIVRGCVFQDNVSGGLAPGFGVRIEGNTFRTNGYGVLLRTNATSGDCLVKDNTFDEDQLIIDGFDNVIDGNTFTDSIPAILHNSGGNLIQRNVFNAGGIGGSVSTALSVVFPTRTGADLAFAGPFDNILY
ncbi:MAG: NosD domain-containing protein [Planctomycetota bacterium]